MIISAIDRAEIEAEESGCYERIATENDKKRWQDLKDTIEDVLFNRDPNATDRLIDLAASSKGAKSESKDEEEWRSTSVEERIKHALVRGDAFAVGVQNFRPRRVVEDPRVRAHAHEVIDAVRLAPALLPERQ